jgi:hypothetical protein
VECGLSREIVFYVFHELNLRLPSNLDTAGLTPYIPTSNGHPSLPHPYPIASFRSEPSPPPSPTRADPLQTSASVNDELEDMEKQRRQELMARKAVQASRKTRQARQATLISQETDVSVPPESVDDFLSTIGPPDSLLSIAVTDPSPLRSPDNMDIDEEIPGLATSRSEAAIMPYNREPDPSELNPASAHVDSPTSLSPKNITPPHSAVSDIPGFSSRASDISTAPRRLLKRPTAADFVDAERVAVTPPISATNGNGDVAYSRVLRAKPTSGFASVSINRRLVIDVSDSESEDIDMDIPNDSTSGNAPGGLLALAYPALGNNSRPPSRPTVDTGLAAKEQEIMRIKRMIAEKEQKLKLLVCQMSCTCLRL